ILIEDVVEQGSKRLRRGQLLDIEIDPPGHESVRGFVKHRDKQAFLRSVIVEDQLFGNASIAGYFVNTPAGQSLITKLLMRGGKHSAHCLALIRLRAILCLHLQRSFAATSGGFIYMQHVAMLTMREPYFCFTNSQPPLFPVW